MGVFEAGRETHSPLFLRGERMIEIFFIEPDGDIQPLGHKQSIQSSKSIPESMTGTIIDKLEGLCSEHQARGLHRDVIVSGRVKTLNEGTRNNIDYIHAAISADKQINFRYFDYTPQMKRQYRKRGAKYTISPYALIYSDENYYLLAYDAELEEIRPYRVDRMEGVNIVEESIREGKEDFDAIDMRKFQKYTFGMFGGEVKEVTMVFPNFMVNSVIDRFGQDIMIHKEDDNKHFAFQWRLRSVHNSMAGCLVWGIM